MTKLLQNNKASRAKLLPQNNLLDQLVPAEDKGKAKHPEVAEDVVTGLDKASKHRMAYNQIRRRKGSLVV